MALRTLLMRGMSRSRMLVDQDREHHPQELLIDGPAFDTLTRSLTTTGSRRRALGSLLAGTLGLFGSQTEQAAARKKKQCPPCKKRKQGKCRGTLPDGAACAGGTCLGGRCVAAAPPPPPPSQCPGLPPRQCV